MSPPPLTKGQVEGPVEGYSPTNLQPYGHRYEIDIQIAFFFFLLKFLADTCPFWGPLVALFWISGDVSSGFQSQSGFCFIQIAEPNVMHIPQDPSLVLHMPTSWLLAGQAVTSPHASAEVGLGSDSNGQSPG